MPTPRSRAAAKNCSAGFQSLIHALHAHTVKANLALLREIVQNAEDFRHIIDFRGRAVQLQQVKRVGVQVEQAALDETGQVLAIVATGNVGVEPPTRFGRHNKLFASQLARSGDQLFRAAIAVDIRRINEVDAQVYGAMQRCNRGSVIGVAPGIAADAPRSKANL